MQCTICNNQKTKLIYSDYPGYVKGTYFDIYKCRQCNAHFADLTNNTVELKKLYETIYSKNIPGNEQYRGYLKKIKHTQKRLNFLARQSPAYLAVKKYLQNKPKLKILEIGCGYGYLTYALNSLGHQTIGIDVSKTAIKSAQESFGENFKETDTASFIPNVKEKFDLIIANELIEHLKNPDQFIKECRYILKKNGEIIITTPNKDYMQETAIWQTYIPPVHTVWLNEKSIQYLAKNNRLNYKLIDLTKNVFDRENNLINYLISRKEKLRTAFLDQNCQPCISKSDNRNIIKKISRSILIDFPPIRFICNVLHALLIRKSIVLGATLFK